jgi:phosphatidylglycerophosphate synthase
VTVATTTRYTGNLKALRAAQKPARGTAAYGRYVNRPAGRAVAALAHTVGMTPNVATAISAVLSGAGLALIALARPSLLSAVGIAVLLAAGYVMDSVDGQLARLRGGGSTQGEWLDHTVDCVKTSSLHLMVAISWFRFPPGSSHALLLVPLGFSIVQSVTYFGLILMPYLRKQAGVAVSGPTGPEPLLRRWLILPTDYGFLCWMFVLFAWPATFAWAYSLLFVAAAAMLALALRKWWRELGASAAATA